MKGMVGIGEDRTEEGEVSSICLLEKKWGEGSRNYMFFFLIILKKLTEEGC